MTKGTWRPVNEAHSIVSMSLLFHLGGHIDSTGFAALDARKNDFGDLPGFRASHAPVVQIGPPGIPAMLQSPPIVEIQMGRSLPSGAIEEQLVIQPNQLSYSTIKYSRWDDVAGKAFGHLRRIAEIAEGVFPTEVSLIYNDQFNFSPRDAEPGPTELLRDGALDLSPRARTINGAFHCFSGYYAPVSGRNTLFNVNYQVMLDDSGGRTATIIVVLRGPVVDISPPLVTVDQWDRLRSTADEMHEASTGLLKGMLSDEMASRIGLHGP